jgi:hypothetical protein
MKNLELLIDDEVVIVPNEMTLGMYQKMMLTPELYENNPIQILSLFTGIPTNQLKNCSTDEIELIEFFLNDKAKIPKQMEVILNFTHNDVEYGLENDWSKLAWGGWVDFEVYSSENIYENLHKIMAILYRPIISKDKKNVKNYKIVPYKSDEIDDRAEIMKQVPLRIWLGAAQFFFSIALIFIKNMQASLEWENKMNRRIMKGWKILPKFLQKKLPLDSILISRTNSQKKTLQNSKKLKI